MATNLKDIHLNPVALHHLTVEGYETVEQINELTDQEALRLPGMTGRALRKIRAAAVQLDPSKPR